MQYEDQSPAAGNPAGYKKGYIDFYKQNEHHANIVQQDSQQYSTQKEVYEEILTAGVCSGSGGIGLGSLTGAVGGTGPLDNHLMRTVPNNKQFFNQVQTDNFLDTDLKNATHEQRREEYKRALVADNKAGAGSKRRSVENMDAIHSQNANSNLRQTEIRGYNTGAKSSIGTYGTGQSSNQFGTTGVLKQINKNKVVEMEVNPALQQQQLFQNNNSGNLSQQKRTLAKSQSQNRLLFVAPETLISKNNPYPVDLYAIAEGTGQNPDKCSFSDQSLGRTGNPQSQDLLYKQHLQYSSGTAVGHHTSKSWQLKAKSNQLLSQMSTKDCTFCNKTGGIHSHSTIPVPHLQCSSIYCIKDHLGLMIQNNLSKKYSTNRDYYNLKIVNDLIYNENTHIVSIFKDYLILDDINEFLKRSYNYSETKTRLPKLCSFYDKYSQVFPNYVILPESKYMFKNIQRKQKLIDEQYKIQEENAQKQHQTLMNEDRLFNSQFYNSVYRLNDLSMSRQQYEDQAKSIATMVGKQYKPSGLRIDQMKIDELVDRFLMKDSESNIQLITTVGLDFSGFTQQSTFINDKLGQGYTPNKQQFKIQPPPQQSSNKGSTISNKTTGKNTASVGQRKESVPQAQGNQPSHQQKKGPNSGSGHQQIQPVGSTKRIAQQQKGSFNSNQVQPSAQANTKAAQGKAGSSNASSSQKTTPRLQKQAPHTLTTGEEGRQQIQTSPATKEAIQNYLHNCQIDGTQSANVALHHQDPLQIKVLDGGIEPLKSPQMQSPQFNPQKLLASSSSQTALSQQMASSSLSTNNRQALKSQCVIPAVQLSQTGKEITNLKKTTRLSSGGASGVTGPHNVIQKTTPINKKVSNVSPMPATQLQTQQPFQTSSRNLVSNSTQKSLKSVNSHAKYLSGGNEQYQRLLQQQQMSSQNPYATQDTAGVHHTGTVSNNFSSQKQGGDMMDTFSKKPLHPQQPYDMAGDDGAVTGEDCDDAGIADERFASPEIFSTADDKAGRKSIQRQQLNAGGFEQNMLTSCEDYRVLSQCNNYDQIKKHLEQYITINQNTEGSNKKYMPSIGSTEKVKLYESVEGGTGYNKVQLAQSAGGASADINNSRNGTASKHFESLKQKIRGVFEGNTDSSLAASANKTPNKSSTHGKKSQCQPQTVMVQQNRMSIESKDMLMLGPNCGPTPQNQGCLSSTSAAGRSLAFTQFNNPNYRSITNIQQRKSGGGSKQQQEGSMEAKRLSQNRQSFKDMQQIQQQEKIKRCATGKTLSINDINQHTFGNIAQPGNNSGITYLQSTTTLCNPNFIPSGSSSALGKQNFTQQQMMSQQQQNSYLMQQQMNASQQAANTVRVMTPSYSLASLSKLISPTQSTSPITMTVTLAQQSHQRKQQQQQQQIGKKMNHPSNHHQANTMANFQVTSSSQHQNFLLADKNTKLISAGMGSKNQSTANLIGKSHRTLNAAQQKQLQPQPRTIQTKLQSSGSQENFSVTPRNAYPTQQQQTVQHHQHHGVENSQNLSCTISTENNSTAKAVETKNPKFMKTIEELSTAQQHQYNTMLSSTMGHRKSGTGLCNSISQAQLDIAKQKQKIQTVVNSNQATIKRSTGGGLSGSGSSGTMLLSSSASVSHFKSPSQQLQAKKQHQFHGKYI